MLTLTAKEYHYHTSKNHHRYKCYKQHKKQLPGHTHTWQQWAGAIIGIPLLLLFILYIITNHPRRWGR